MTVVSDVYVYALGVTVIDPFRRAAIKPNAADTVISQLIGKTMTTRPQDRPQSMSEVLMTLAE